AINRHPIADTGEDRHGSALKGLPADLDIDHVLSAFVDFYSCLRFMDWGTTNEYTGTSWNARRQPNDASNFDLASNPIAAKDAPGLAYEWMIDLCNRAQADMWVCVPTRADDNFVTQLATLIKNNLNSGLKVYVEYSNEVWNFAPAQNYCAAQGASLGFPQTATWERALVYQAYRSAQVWKKFEDVFGNQKNRVINVLAGKSTSPSITNQQHLSQLYNLSFNPTDVLPEAYAIAPYFGGNGLNGATSNIFAKLREDIFVQRPAGASGAGQASRLKNVQDQHAIVVGQYNLNLIAYEGGQHLAVNAINPNRNAEMYNVYTEYFDAMAPYFSLFCHYTHAGTFSNGGCWGAKEFTGQAISQAHKYRAMKDWMDNNSSRKSQVTVELAAPFYPNPTTGALNIELSHAQSVDIEVYNLSGQKIMDRQMEGRLLKLDLSHLSNGMYILSVNGQHSRIMKQN
ncbi:MAG: T9SS type A sorting domain-containing protein, partial [Bacteroidota bacterium]